MWVDEEEVMVDITNSAEAVWIYRKVTGRDTQEALAHHLRIPRWVVSEWETGIPNGHRIPSTIWYGATYKKSVPISIAMQYERWKRGITMEELGALLGVSKQTINSWEQCEGKWKLLARSWGFNYSKP